MTGGACITGICGMGGIEGIGMGVDIGIAGMDGIEGAGETGYAEGAE